MSARIVQILAFTLIAGCGGGGSGGPSGMPSKFLYANASGGPNTFPTNTYGFAVYSSGALSQISGFLPVPAQDYGGGPLVITRDSKLLYTPYFSKLEAFQINPNGSLTKAPSPSFDSGTQVGLVAHPTADFLYASSSSGVLSVLAIDSGTGALNLASTVSLSGNNIVVGNSAVITLDGRYLYQTYVEPSVSDQLSGQLQLAGFSIDSASGALSAVPGSPVSTTIQAGTSFPIGQPMVIDPTGNFLYVSYSSPVVNGSQGDVAAFSIDPSSGALTAVPGSPFSLSGTPFSVAIDASGKFLIVSATGTGNCLDVFSIDRGTGTLALVAGSPFVGCGGIAADPSGPFVYAGSQSDTGPPGVVVLSVDQTVGALAPVGQAMVPDSSKIGLDFIAVTH